MILVFTLLAALFLMIKCETRNDRPIIGILAQKQWGKQSKYGDSYIAASYVKYLESAGARVIPIMVNQTQEYYKDLFNSINGVLFPGGGADLSSSGYGKAGKVIFDLAVKSNEAGNYFPLWGTCLGFELLNFIAVNKDWRHYYWIQDVALPLISEPGYNNSRLFQNVSKDIEHILTTEPVTINYHQWSLTPANYSKSGLDKFYKILTLSEYENLTFITTIEAFNYPFYGVAWHPEKNPFEFVNDTHHRNIPHTPNAIRVSQYFANFFVNEARKNHHRFQNETDEGKALIYNYQAVYTRPLGSSFEQKYFFGMTSGGELSIRVHQWKWIEILCAIWFMFKVSLNISI